MEAPRPPYSVGQPGPGPPPSASTFSQREPHLEAECLVPRAAPATQSANSPTRRSSRNCADLGAERRVFQAVAQVHVVGQRSGVRGTDIRGGVGSGWGQATVGPRRRPRPEPAWTDPPRTLARRERTTTSTSTSEDTSNPASPGSEMPAARTSRPGTDRSGILPPRGTARGRRPLRAAVRRAGERPALRPGHPPSWSSTSTKGATAACANLLVQRGELDLRVPGRPLLARVRPVREGGSPRPLPPHPSGRAPGGRRHAEPGRGPGLGSGDRRPGSPARRCGSRARARLSHAVRYGSFVGEVVRRVTGRSLGTYLRRRDRPDPRPRVAGSDCPRSRTGSAAHGGVLPGVRAADAAAAAGFSSTLFARALNFGGAFSEPGWANGRDWHAAELPAANGITNAASLSRLYAGLSATVEGGPRRADPEQGPGGPGPHRAHFRCRPGVRLGAASPWSSASARDSGSPAPSRLSEAPARSDTPARAGLTASPIRRTAWPSAT